MDKKKTGDGTSNNERTLGQLLTVKEAATYLRVSSRTVNRLLDNREIGHVKVGSRVLIPSKSINTFLEKHYVAPLDAGAIARSILEGRRKL